MSTNIIIPSANSLTSLANEINPHHELACLRAGEAVSHATQAGKLLLSVKATLPHGEFGGWMEKSLKVTPRQAQRYMAAAQGKPVPIRAIAPNTTHVSYFKVNEGEAVHIDRVLGDWQDMAVIYPHADSAGYFHYAFLSGQLTEGGRCTYSKRGLSAKAVSMMVFRDYSASLDKADIARFAHPGFSKNPFAEEDVVSAMNAVQLVLHENIDLARELVEQFIADNTTVERGNLELFKLLDGGDEYELLPLPGDSLATVKISLNRAIALAGEPVSLNGAKRHKTAMQRKKIGMLARTALALLAVKGSAA